MSVYFGSSLVGTSGINGDVFYVSPDCTTIMLADGASGAGDDGKVMMAECCAKSIKEFPFANSGLSPKKYLDELIWKINNELISISQDRKKYTFGTLVICIISNNIATFAAAGDSPAFVICKGNIERKAKTKKSYYNLVQMGLYTEEQLEEYVHKLPEYMWSMFDTFIPTIVPRYALEECHLNDGDIVVLCCDGVSDYLGKSDLLQLVDHNNLFKSVDTIISTAKAKAIEEHNEIRYDDITVVLYQHEHTMRDSAPVQDK